MTDEIFNQPVEAKTIPSRKRSRKVDLSNVKIPAGKALPVNLDKISIATLRNAVDGTPYKVVSRKVSGKLQVWLTNR